jgi:hypothetical protein
MKISTRCLQIAEQRAAVEERGGHQVDDFAFPLDLPRHTEQRSQQFGPLLLHDVVPDDPFTLPVSSSSVTTITPDAVPGRCLQVTIPAARTQLPCDNSESCLALFNRMAAS